MILWDCWEKSRCRSTSSLLSKGARHCMEGEHSSTRRHHTPCWAPPSLTLPHKTVSRLARNLHSITLFSIPSFPSLLDVGHACHINCNIPFVVISMKMKVVAGQRLSSFEDWHWYRNTLEYIRYNIDVTYCFRYWSI